MNYPDGSFGSAGQGRHLRLLDAFVEKQNAVLANPGQFSAEEAMSVSDFGTYFATIIRTTFLGTWQEVQGSWAEWTHPMPLEDFEEYSSYRWGRFPDWPQRPLNSDVEMLAIREYAGPKVRLYEWAAGFALTRQLVLADRARRLLDLPAMLGDAGGRTQTKRAVAQLESNPVMFDGNALFSNAHANIGTTALTADVAGVNALKVAIDAINNQTDDEGYKVNTGAAGGSLVLLVPYALRWIAEALEERELVPLDVTLGTSVLRPNEVVGQFEVVVDRFLTDTNNWYLLLNPTGPQGFMAALNLNGVTRPSLFQKDDKKIGILGTGEDPYTWRWDQLEFMGRHDFEYKPTEFRSAFGSIVP